MTIADVLIRPRDAPQFVILPGLIGSVLFAIGGKKAARGFLWFMGGVAMIVGIGLLIFAIVHVARD